MADPHTTALEAQLTRALQGAWRNSNWSLFGESMRAPVLSLVDSAGLLGRWNASTRELQIQRAFAMEQPWTIVLEVLRHEMAHQFVDEVLRIRDETAHGPVFRKICAQRGIDASAAGVPNLEPNEGESRIIDRVSKLLALAGSANQHEAEAAMARAQALMQAHNVRAVEAKTPRRYTFRQLGSPKGRIYEPERRLACLIQDHFFVDVIWVPAYDVKRCVKGSVMEVCGTPENLAIAEFVHGFMLETAERLWRAHRREQGIDGNKDRRRFLSGVMLGFADKLDKQRAQTNDKAMVWVADADLMRYMRRRHPRTTTVHRGGSGRNEAYHAGREAGRNIVLSQPVTSGTARSRGRLLGSGRS